MPLRHLPLALLVAAIGSGCSLVTVGLHATTNWGEGHHDEVLSAGPKERRVAVDTIPLQSEAIPERPAAPQEPAPEYVPAPPSQPGVIVVVPPQPSPPPPPAEPQPTQLVGPPWGTAPLHFGCRIDERNTTERVRNHYFVYGTIEKLFLGFVGVFDTALAIGAFSSLNRQGEDAKTSTMVLGTIAALDAAGLVGLIAFAKGEWRSEEYDTEGLWKQGNPTTCPAGLTAQAGPIVGDVDPNGALDPTMEAMLVQALVTQRKDLELELAGEHKPVGLDEWTRCEWAKGRHQPLPSTCSGARPWPIAPVLFPLK